MMRILQITDPHLYGTAGGSLRGVETDSSLRTVLDAAFARERDYAALLVTGDLVQDDPSGYLRFKSIFGHLRVPVLCVPGNHDEPQAMRQSLAQPPFEYCGTHTIGSWQLIMLDSVEPGKVGGRLGTHELTRLDTALAEAEGHAMICLHHHPVDMDSRWLDGIGLADRDEFWRVIDAHARVRGVLFGHVHQEFEGERNGVRLFGTPSTCAQFVQKSERFAVDESPPAYRSFDLAHDGGINSQIHWVESSRQRQAAAR
jgi:3',5'-cyclic-AMP phosphodiesterase